MVVGQHSQFSFVIALSFRTIISKDLLYRKHKQKKHADNISEQTFMSRF